MNHKQIISFTPHANFHRNTCRKSVDKIFAKKDSALANKNFELAKKLDAKARLIWHKIIDEANQM
jgi:hypothetical protein